MHRFFPALLLLSSFACSDPRIDALEARVTQLETDNARLLADNQQMRAELDEILAEKRDRAERLARLTQRRSALRDHRDPGSAEDEEEVEVPSVWEGKVLAISDTEAVVSPDLVAKMLDEPELLSHQARLIPHLGPDGEADGFRLSGIRRESLIASLGIRNGDVLHAINGHALTSVEEGLVVYTEARDATELRLDMTRRGSPMVLLVRIGAVEAPQ